MTRNGQRRISSTTLGKGPGTCGFSLDQIGMLKIKTLYYRNEKLFDPTHSAFPSQRPSQQTQFPISHTPSTQTPPFKIHGPRSHPSPQTSSSPPANSETIYALITTCKRFRSTILLHANPIARRRLINDEPWYLPAGPFELNLNSTMSKMRGRQEVEWWANQWAAGGIAQEDMDTKIPWLSQGM
jgi:hypothetical protein